MCTYPPGGPVEMRAAGGCRQATWRARSASPCGMGWAREGGEGAQGGAGATETGRGQLKSRGEAPAHAGARTSAHVGLKCVVRVRAWGGTIE